MAPLSVRLFVSVSRPRAGVADFAALELHGGVVERGRVADGDRARGENGGAGVAVGGAQRDRARAHLDQAAGVGAGDRAVESHIAGTADGERIAARGDGAGDSVARAGDEQRAGG